jgi:hypothetical protein
VEKENIARTRVFLWLGLIEEISNVYANMPNGYGLSENFINYLGLPTKTFFNGKTQNANLYFNKFNFNIS